MTWLGWAHETVSGARGSNRFLKEIRKKKKNLNDKPEQPEGIESWQCWVWFPCVCLPIVENSQCLERETSPALNSMALNSKMTIYGLHFPHFLHMWQTFCFLIFSSLYIASLYQFIVKCTWHGHFGQCISQSRDFSNKYSFYIVLKKMFLLLSWSYSFVFSS